MSLSKKTSVDRISLLPDSLLHSILSLLNTRQVVQTCVLSKRWKTLWTNIPTLNFDFDSYLNSNASNLKESSFECFMLRVLSEHRCKYITTLSFSSSSEYENTISFVEWLICFASHTVQELCLNTYSTIYNNWPCCLSACSSLVVLKIKCVSIDDYGALKSPSLRILEIECYWDHNDDDDGRYNGIKMFSGCPNLESLVWVFDNFFFESATICAPKLENLELCASSKWLLNYPQVELLAPNLKTLKFCNVLPTLKSASSEFSCIDKVNIQVKDCNFEGLHSRTSTRKFYRLLRLFHNSRSFTLPLKALEVINMSVPLNRFSFRNLRHLKLKTKETNKQIVIDLPITTFAFLNNCPKPITTFTFLQTCPNLQMMTVDPDQE